MKRAPAHAGTLRGSERFAFALVFVLMAAFVVGLAVAASGPGAPAVSGPTAAAGSRTVAAGTTGAPQSDQAAGTGAVTGSAGQHGQAAITTRQAPAALNARLATALRPVARADSGQLSVGVIDETTGAEALYRAGRRYHAASIVKADILAALLYQHQAARTPMSAGEADLAVQMMENSSDAAAAKLWAAIGGGPGLAAANRALLLAHTVPGPGRFWALSGTTVTDQLQLLADLMSGHSALDSAARDYELGLMANVVVSQRWGVPAAASRGAAFAVQNGWLADPRLWVVNSIGVVQHGGQQLLIVILSKGNPAETSGISAVRAAAEAAAAAITAAGS